MKNFRIYNNIVGWLVFAVAAVTYLLTIEPTASFWDCSEFIATADKLEVGHPPGAPLFMLMGRMFSIFASDASQVAKMINSFSALCSAFSILFLFWTITHFARKIVVKSSEKFTLWNTVAILGSGAVGALAYTFSDTFWFSAVEGEVYAFSSFFTAIVFWCILRWEESQDTQDGTRWIILLAYLMGLSIGVHLLNLLAIPAIVLVYYFKKNKEVSWKGVVLAVASSFAIVVFVLYGLIPGFTKVAGVFELFFVNTVGLSFNSGLFIYLAVLIVLFVLSLYVSHQGKNGNLIKILFLALMIALGVPFFGNGIVLGLMVIAVGATLLFYIKKWNYKWINTIIVCAMVMIVGYSSYALIIIRSSANPPIDQNSPEDVFTLQSYLNRDQYGYSPLFYGHQYNAPQATEVVGNQCRTILEYGKNIIIRKNKIDPNEKDKYINVGKDIVTFKSESKFNTIFPRMWSPQAHHVAAYKEWADIKGRRMTYSQCGQAGEVVYPTFGENLQFFLGYQLNFMYFRYFMWNFVGRQNDMQSTNGELDKGQWISGIPFIDNAMYGDQSKLPDYLKENKGNNKYYFLPLILGILGMVWQLGNAKKGKQHFWITFSLFFMTGIAIVIYLNQYPYQPRERDYAFAGSFYAFCIWIGLGMLCIVDMLKKLPKPVAVLGALLLSMSVPALMASQNWDDHDRSNRYLCKDMGYNYLNSTGKNSIIFCNGDNDTFPLWYNQEVEGERTDIKTCNLSYVTADWYIDQMKREYYDAPPLNIDLEPSEYQRGTLDWVSVKDYPMFNGRIDINHAFDILKNPEYQQDGMGIIPATTLLVPIDKQKVIESGIVEPSEYDNILDTLELKLTKPSLSKGDMIVLNLIKNNDWSRPIYFCSTVGNEFYPSAIRKYLQNVGLANQLVPILKNSAININATYNNVMNRYKYNLTADIYFDETSRRACRSLKQNFIILASSLANENRNEEAKKVLEKCVKEIPQNIIPLEDVDIYMADTYFKIGQNQEGEALLQKLVDFYEQNMTYVLSLPIEKRKHVSPEISLNSNVSGLQNCYFLANQHKSKKLEEIKAKLEKYHRYLNPAP